MLGLFVLVVVRLVTKSDFLFPLPAERFSVGMSVDGRCIPHENSVVRPFQNTAQLYQAASNPNKAAGGISHAAEGFGSPGRRSFGKESCKKRGANLKRKKGPEQDGALKLFKQLRDRMYARMIRYGDAPENQRDRLLSMTVPQYGEWEENVRQARREYVAGRLTAEEFLRRIDTTHELSSYDTAKQELPPEESAWQGKVAGNPDFDPMRSYPSSMMVLDLRSTADDPRWQFLTREDLMREDQEGHQSLRDEYKKKPDRLSPEDEK